MWIGGWGGGGEGLEYVKDLLFERRFEGYLAFGEGEFNSKSAKAFGYLHAEFAADAKARAGFGEGDAEGKDHGVGGEFAESDDGGGLCADFFVFFGDLDQEIVDDVRVGAVCDFDDQLIAKCRSSRPVDQLLIEKGLVGQDQKSPVWEFDGGAACGYLGDFAKVFADFDVIAHRERAAKQDDQARGKVACESLKAESKADTKDKKKQQSTGSSESKELKSHKDAEEHDDVGGDRAGGELCAFGERQHRVEIGLEKLGQQAREPDADAQGDREIAERKEGDDTTLVLDKWKRQQARDREQSARDRPRCKRKAEETQGQ